MKKIFLTLLILSKAVQLNSAALDIHEDRLIKAAEHGNLTIVKEIISKKLADPNVKSFYGTPVLIWAILSGNEELVIYLLENGANAKTSDMIGKKPSAHAKTTKLSTKLINILEILENPKKNSKTDFLELSILLHEIIVNK